MQTIRAVAVGGAVLVLAAGVFFTSTLQSLAQLQVRPDVLPFIKDGEAPDSLVRIVAESQGLPLVPLDKLPRYGTYWEAFSPFGSILAPMPWLPGEAVAVYEIAPNCFLVDNGQGTPISPPPQRGKLPPLTPEELVARQVEDLLNLIAQVQQAALEQPPAPTETSSANAPQMMSTLAANGPGTRPTCGPLDVCLTNGPVMITNVWAGFDTNGAMTVLFDLVGGTNGPNFFYDLYSTTNLLTGSWTWLARGPSCHAYQFTNQPGAAAFYKIGPSPVPDGENRIQTENAITGTTNWRLFNPITASDEHGWPTNDADTLPEIQGFASETSVNAGNPIDLYVDVRWTNNPVATNFTLEVFRLGWYGGRGGRQMTWTDGVTKTNIVLSSRKQPVPKMNPTNGLVDCLSGWTTNGTDTNLIWQKSYTLTVPTNWVSGVYVARLTTGTDITPQTSGKQSYIIFTVREDARASDLLCQASVTTWQAYNPWGGASLYPYPSSASCQNIVANYVLLYASKVSFNRPYAPPTCYLGYLPLGYGSGAGEFLTVINQFATAAWEYDMVRWLERQGYDVTYSTSVDTHRTNPADKRVKAFLSVGHDEYWSAAQRANVESARDRGVNLGFFGANICYARIHYEDNERAFSVNKTASAHGYYDLWRDTIVNNPEISMIGVEYAYNAVDTDLTMPNPLASGSGIGGLHWAYDYAGLMSGTVLTGLLGSEVDGCWSPTNLSCIPVLADCPAPETVRLADSIFFGCTNAIGHSYMTIYTACNGAQVFATGTMQWNWGLDDFGALAQFPPKFRANPAAQQMTHNVLRTFSGLPTAPVLFTNTDSLTSGNWTNTFGAEGYWIANTPVLTNLPAYAQVTLSGQQVQVWTNLTTDTRALLLPVNYTNRIASAWTTTTNLGSSFTIDLNLAAGHTNQIALYCADWLGTGTVLERIEVFDYTDPSHPLDTRNFQLPANGVYLVWKLSGHKIIRVSKTDATPATKAIVSGLFIGSGT